MASRIAAANSAFNTAATWGLVDATSLLDTEAGTNEPGTSYTASANFTPGAIEVDGVAVKLADAGTGAYTISLQLYNATDSVAVAGTEVTINRADLCSATAASNEGGWVFFKFASPVTLEAAHNYNVQLKESNAGANVLFYRNGTANNWARMLRTTTTGAPAATDILHVMEEKTGAGAATTRTVTMDQIAASIVDLGSGTDATVAITISDGGTLNFDVQAATAYYLKCSGNLIVYNGGTFTIGTVGSEIPRDSTAILEFDPVADGGMGLIVRNGGTFTAQGLSRTVGKNVVSCLLNTDEAVNQTELGVDTDTGWLDNDEIVVASTSRTYSECEKGTLNGNADTNHLDVDGFAGAGGGLANAHSGTSPTQAEVILLTRNVKIRSASSSIMTYVYIQGTTATVDIDWVEFYYLGENATGKYGIVISTITGRTNIQYCSLYNCEDYGLYISLSGSALIDNVFSNNTIYNIASTGSSLIQGIYLLNVGNLTFSGNVLLYTGASSASMMAFSTASLNAITFTNNRIANARNAGIELGYYGVNPITSAQTGSWSGNIIHSCGGNGIGWPDNATNGAFGGYANGIFTLGETTIWRCNASGLEFNNSNQDTSFFNLLFQNWTIFGCNGSSIEFSFYTTADSNNPGFFKNIIFDNLVSNGDSSFSTTNGISFGETGGNQPTIIYFNINFLNCDFSTVAGIKTAHTNDFIINTTTDSNGLFEILMINTKLGGTTEINGITSLALNSYIKSQKHDQTTGNHKSWFKYGIISSDDVADMYRTASPSERLTPNNASNKLESGNFKVNVNSGQTCTPHVYVRESVVGDGTDYNGNRPRLILKRNDAIGITVDTVLDTATISSEGAFEELTGTTAAATDNGVMEFVVDCDGTTGWVNVDDFSATVA